MESITGALHQPAAADYIPINYIRLDYSIIDRHYLNGAAAAAAAATSE